MREEFEKLPEIAEILESGNAKWCEDMKMYIGYDADFVNGALYAYQEQQKIINMQECGAKKILEIISDDGLMYETMIERIKELLK